jgi:hypothetical protein
MLKADGNKGFKFSEDLLSHTKNHDPQVNVSIVLSNFISSRIRHVVISIPKALRSYQVDKRWTNGTAVSYAWTLFLLQGRKVDSEMLMKIRGHEV